MTAHRRRDRVWVPERAWLRPETDPQGDRVGAGFMLLVTLLAAAARFYHLGRQPLWVDEVMTWDMVRPGAGLHFTEQLLDMIQGPLYLAAIWPLAQRGLSEFALRLPAALAGVAAVPLLGVLAQRLWGGRTARVAMVMLALSPFHLWYSQEARGYSFVIFFGLAASLAFLSCVDRPDSRRAMLYALLAAATAASNLSGSLLIGGHLLALLVVVRPPGRSQRLLWLGAYAAVAVLLAPWVLRASGILAVERLVPGADSGALLRGATTFTPAALPYTGFAFFFGYSLGPSLTELHAPNPAAVVRPFLPLLAGTGTLALLLLAAGVARLGRRPLLLLTCWTAVPVVVVIVLAVQNVKPYNARYLATVFPWVLLATAHGLTVLPRRLGRALGLLLAGLFLWSLYGLHSDPRYYKEDLRAAGQWIAARADPQTAVLVPVVTRTFRLYYRGDGQIVPFWDVAPIGDGASAETALAEKLMGQSHGFLVLSRIWEVDPLDRLPAALAAQATIESETTFPGVRVLQWRRDQSVAGGDRRGT